ncbi:uncharacterized protein ACNLHF_008899 isoform 2-T2 [Anomaloglossus baeobatrachus]
MGDRRHAYSVVTRRLWDEVCSEVVTGWEDFNPRAQNRAREKVQNRWRSIRDRFKKELNKEMLAPSGSGGRVSRYKYFRVLAFLRTTMVCRSTICSTREPASNPFEAIPTQSATGEHLDRLHPSAPSLSSGPSVPSTSAGASCEASLHEAAADEVAFPLPHPSDTAALSRTPLGSRRQRQRGLDRSYALEFLHLNAAFQNAIKLLSEQTSAAFSLVQNTMQSNTDELCTRLDRLHLDARKSTAHCFFQAVLERMENLSPEQQMHVMQATQYALAQVTYQPPPITLIPPAPSPPPPSSHCPSSPTYTIPASCPVPASSPVPVPNICASTPCPTCTPCPVPPVSFHTHPAPTTTLFFNHHLFCHPIPPLHPSILTKSHPISCFSSLFFHHHYFTFSFLFSFTLTKIHPPYSHCPSVPI